MDLKQQINQGVDQCVKCGLCLPHCPTYKLSQDENESPRGRLALMQALASEQLELSEKLQTHLDHCLSCRACERVCPSSVQYGSLIDNAKQLMQQDPKAKALPLLSRFFINALGKHQRVLGLLNPLLWAYQKLGLQQLIHTSGLLKLVTLDKMHASLLPAQAIFSLPEFLPAIGTERGQVGLFIGCTAKLFDSQTLKAAIHVLRRNGFAVWIPKNQGCCGALHAHSGDQAQSKQLMRQNIKAFANPKISAIISFASGCAATCQEYEKPVFSDSLFDISEFLNQHWDEKLKLKPLNETIAIHTPCTLRNVLKKTQAPFELLSRIPNATIIPLGNSEDCCGAAGTNMLNYPQIAEELVGKLLNSHPDPLPSRIASSNIGCAMHLCSAYKQQKSSLEILHPVAWLEKQLA